MMAEQKGRSGKKPKYQIADIGGPDLTSQDISTERVLNFLIKGEIGSAADQTKEAEAGSPAPEHTSLEQAPTVTADDSVATPLPSPETQGKKSLAHLFSRASGGRGGTVKDLKLDLGIKESAVMTQPEPQVTKLEQSPQIPAAHEVSTAVSELSAPTLRPSVPPQPVESRAIAASEPSTALSPMSEELAQLTTLWKSFYRLNDGEIEAMKALYQMSHGEGSSECYIKMRKLAEMSNLTYRYCQKLVRSLEQLGWITKLKDYDASTQLGVLYRVNLTPIL